jgi:hypothetical protein
MQVGLRRVRRGSASGSSSQVGQLTLLDLVKHIGELVSGGVVRDKRDREASAKAIAVNADVGLSDSIDMREPEGAIG